MLLLFAVVRLHLASTALSARAANLAAGVNRQSPHAGGGLIDAHALLAARAGEPIDAMSVPRLWLSATEFWSLKKQWGVALARVLTAQVCANQISVP